MRKEIEKEENREEETFDSYLRKLKRELSEVCPPNYSITEKVVDKANGVKKLGLEFAQKNSILRPVLYPIDHFELYKEGMSIEEIAASYIASVIRSRNVDASDLLLDNYERIKNRLMIRIVNRELNKELLVDAPVKYYGDMAMTVYAYFSDFAGSCVSVHIVNNMLKDWGITEKDLFRDAINSSVMNFPIVICGRNHENLMEEGIFTSDLTEVTPQDEVLLITNGTWGFGASALFYPGVMEKLEDQLSSPYYVIPSSVHDVIIKKVGGPIDADALRSTLFRVNREEVDKEEFLSDSLYYYCKEEGGLKIV